MFIKQERAAISVRSTLYVPADIMKDPAGGYMTSSGTPISSELIVRRPNDVTYGVQDCIWFGYEILGFYDYGCTEAEPDVNSNKIFCLSP